jgi:hypothetical protein
MFLAAGSSVLKVMRESLSEAAGFVENQQAPPLRVALIERPATR